MAWIESHQTIDHHPKMLKLARAMNWSRFDAIGRLHVFWHWCLDYAPDGQLDKHGPMVIAEVFGVVGTESERAQFIAALRESEFVDFEPRMQVHDWWDFAGRFLQVRYKRHPKIWKQIKALYVRNKQPNNNRTTTELSAKNNHKPNLTKPNLTKPNLTNVVVGAATTECVTSAGARARRLPGRGLSRETKLEALEALALTDDLQAWAQRELGVQIPADVLDEFKAYWREQSQLRTDWIATLRSRIRQLVARGILSPPQKRTATTVPKSLVDLLPS